MGRHSLAKAAISVCGCASACLWQYLIRDNIEDWCVFEWPHKSYLWRQRTLRGLQEQTQRRPANQTANIDTITGVFHYSLCLIRAIRTSGHHCCSVTMRWKNCDSWWWHHSVWMVTHHSTWSRDVIMSKYDGTDFLSLAKKIIITLQLKVWW